MHRRWSLTANSHYRYFKLEFCTPGRRTKFDIYFFDISAISGPIFLKQTSPVFQINYHTSVLAVNFIPTAKVVKSQKRPLSHY